MSWSLRRQLTIVLALLIIAGGVGFLVYSPKIFIAPTCSDMKQNGEEKGIDCGGTCATMCVSETHDPVVLWSRSFPITDSVYNAIAYVENQNAGALQSLPYEFRFYDEKGVFVARVQGSALIPPLGRYAIVATGVQAGNAKITRTTITFGDHKPWTRIPEKIANIRVATSNIRYEKDPMPRLSATLSNISPVTPLSNVSVTAILYGTSGNAVAVSTTIVPQLAPSASTDVYFTWPKSFSEEVVRFEIIPVIDVFQLSA